VNQTNVELLLQHISQEQLRETLGDHIVTPSVPQTEKKENKQSETEWEPPIPFDENRLPAFPASIFPNWLRAYVEGVAESTQTPVDAASIGAISILSTALTKKFYISITPEWSESLNTYSILALPPGNRKSSVFKALQEPITTFEKEERERMEPLVSEQRATLKARRKRVEQLEKDYAKKGDNAILNEITALNAEIDNEEILTIPRFITGDVTAEKLGVLMGENNERIAVLSAEGGGVFSNMAGRYSSDGRANIEIYLNGHTGDYTPIDRIGREPILLNEPCLTIGLFVQPEVIRDVPPSFDERGLMQRFLYSFPPSIVGYRKTSPESIPEEVRSAYIQNIKKMMQLFAGEPVKLTFTESAKEKQLDLREYLESMFRDGGRLADMKEWGGKLAGQIIRISGLLHVSEHVESLNLGNLDIKSIPSKISLETFIKACKLLNYFIDHAKKAYGVMAIDEGAEDAKHLLKYLLQSGKERYSRQEVWQGTKGRFKTTKRYDMAINELEERNYIKKVERNTTGRGRKSYDLLLNPIPTNPTIPINAPNVDISRNTGNREKNPTNNLQFLELNKGNEQLNSRNTRINREMQSPYFNPNDDKALTNSRNSRDDFKGYENKNNDGS
jgi:replicative DNA helicase